MDIMQLAAAPSFIRNIVDSRRQLIELIIPKAFVGENPNIFQGCTSVILQAPGGQEYEVDLKRKNDNIVLTDGWNDFAKHYDVDLGYFLVFHYLGSHFHVKIADTSNVEIDYTPYHCQCIQEEEEEEIEEEDNDGDNNEIVVRRGYDTTSVAYGKAELCKCDGPSFIVVMKPSYLSNDYRMWVPIRHGHRYLKDGPSKVKLVVEVANGGTATWKVKLISGPTSVRLGAGWKKFVQNNGLSARDVCKFELVDRTTQTYLVHIFTDDEEH